MQLADFPLPWRFRRIPVPVWVRSVRHAALLMLGWRAEAPLNDCFLSAAATAQALRLWDVGANIGWYSWIFLSQSPHAEAILLEPDPTNLKLVRRTARRLEGRATILPVAAGDRTGRMLFAADTVTGATGSIMVEDTFLTRHYRRNGGMLEVETVRLDDLRQRFPPPDFIKIDVEGAELLVMDGAASILRSQPVVIYETTAANRNGMAARFAELGYRLFDAEGYGCREQVSPNVLAWPPRLENRTAALMAEWIGRRANRA